MSADNQQSMTARTVSFTHGHTHRQPSPRAQAARSVFYAYRLSGQARSEAIREHFASFVLPATGSTCSRR